MEFNVKFVHLEVVFFARKCGISCNFMLELAKNLSAMCLVAGLSIIFLYYEFSSLLLLIIPPPPSSFEYYIVDCNDECIFSEI